MRFLQWHREIGGAKMEISTARNSEWLAMFVVLISRRGRDGSEKIAVAILDQKECRLPSKVAPSQNDLLNPSSVVSAFSLDQSIVETAALIHLDTDRSNSAMVVRSFWSIKLADESSGLDVIKGYEWVQSERLPKRVTHKADLYAFHKYLASDMRMPETLRHKNIFGRLFSILPSSNRQRLMRDIRRRELALLGYYNRCSKDPFYNAAFLCLSKASSAFKQYDYQGSWSCVTDFDRNEIFLMTNEELLAKKILLEEQGRAKLKGWRQESFERIMKRLSDSDSTTLIAAAHDLIVDSQETKFYNIELLRNQTNLIASILCICTFLFLSISTKLPLLNVDLKSMNYSSIGDFWLLLAIFLLGAIGACASALVGFSPSQQTLRVPDRLLSSIITLVRPVIGGACALAGTFSIMSGILDQGNLDIGIIYLGAFAFGFSERAIITTVGRFRTKERP